MDEKWKYDEVKFRDYWEAALKRKFLLLAIFLVVISSTTIVNLLLPPIYRGVFMVSMATGNYSDLLDRINSNDRRRLQEILPNTYEKLEEINLTPLKDTIFFRLKIVIDVADTSNILPIRNELFNYLTNFPFYKRSVKLKAERMQNELNELSKVISYLEGIFKKNDSAKVDSIQLPYLENLYKNMVEMIERKVLIEQWLSNQYDLLIISEEILKKPVKPNIAGNLIKAFIFSFLLSLFVIYFSAQFKR